MVKIVQRHFSEFTSSLLKDYFHFSSKRIAIKSFKTTIDVSENVLQDVTVSK